MKRVKKYLVVPENFKKSSETKTGFVHLIGEVPNAKKIFEYAGLRFEIRLSRREKMQFVFWSKTNRMGRCRPAA